MGKRRYVNIFDPLTEENLSQGYRGPANASSAFKLLSRRVAQSLLHRDNPLTAETRSVKKTELIRPTPGSSREDWRTIFGRARTGERL